MEPLMTQSQFANHTMDVMLTTRGVNVTVPGDNSLWRGRFARLEMCRFGPNTLSPKLISTLTSYTDSHCGTYA